MMKKLMHNSLAAAGFAALLLVGACASTNDTAPDGTVGGDDMVEVTQSSSVAPAPGPAKVDSDGNIYSSSAAPGSGNAASVGTNTNVNVVPERSSITTVESTTLQSEEAVLDEAAARGTISGTSPTTDNTATFDTTTTTRTETVTAPTMTSSTTDTQSTTTTVDTDTTTATTTRTRMRKD